MGSAVRRTPECAGVAGARCYLARVDGSPAAAAVLFVAGDIDLEARPTGLSLSRPPAVARRGPRGARLTLRFPTRPHRMPVEMILCLTILHAVCGKRVRY